MQYKTIICPVTGGELDKVAIPHAAYLGKVSGAKVILLNVVEKWYRGADVVTSSPEWGKIHQDWLREGEEVLLKEAADLKEAGYDNVETLLRDGAASYEIVGAAKEYNADLIVMATHRYSPIGKLFMGSVIDKVSKNAPCPVLWVFK